MAKARSGTSWALVESCELLSRGSVVQHPLSFFDFVVLRGMRELIFVAMLESWCAAARGRLKPTFFVTLLDVPRHALNIDSVCVTQ